MTTLKAKAAGSDKSTVLPRVHLIATGGTIAGVAKPDEASGLGAYVSAQRSGESLLQALPDLLARAQWTFEQPYSIGSQNLQPQHMLTLRDCILKALHSPLVDAIVVTHGTDTLEDMLFFLYLTLPVHRLTKPVVFTASMLPSDHPQADGPANLSSALDWALGLHGSACFDEALSVLRLGAVLNGLFTPAACVRKKSTAGLGVFDAPCSIRTATLNNIDATEPTADLLRRLASDASLALSTLEGMPTQGQFSGFAVAYFDGLEVPVVYCTPGSSARNQLQDLLHRHDSGTAASSLACVVVAAPGHGNIPDDCVPLLKALLEKGVNVVRASRIGEGGVVQGGEFDALDSYRHASAPGEAPSHVGGVLPIGCFFEAGDLGLPQLVVLHRLIKSSVESLA